MSRFHICFTEDEHRQRIEDAGSVTEVNDMAESVKECPKCLDGWVKALTFFAESVLNDMHDTDVEGLRREIETLVSWETLAAVGMTDGVLEFCKSFGDFFDAKMDKEKRLFLMTFIPGVVAEMMAKLVRSANLGKDGPPEGRHIMMSEVIMRAAFGMIEKRLRWIDPAIRIRVSYSREDEKKGG